MPQPISSSLMSRDVLSAEDLQCFQPSKMKKCEVDVKKKVARGCSRKTGKAGLFSMLAKISLGLRKFRNPSENFAM